MLAETMCLLGGQCQQFDEGSKLSMHCQEVILPPLGQGSAPRTVTHKL